MGCLEGSGTPVLYIGRTVVYWPNWQSYELIINRYIKWKET